MTEDELRLLMLEDAERCRERANDFYKRSGGHRRYELIKEAKQYERNNNCKNRPRRTKPLHNKIKTWF